MRFGKSWNEVKEEPTGGDGTGYIRYPGKNPVTLRILDEPEQWEGWWEHFDQQLRKSYPCTGDRGSCPGCTSDNERTRKAGRKVGFNVVMQSQDGNFYVNVFKITRKTAEKLELRATRNGTIRDRDFIITQIKTDPNAPADYDVEGLDVNPVDLSSFDAQRHDIQDLLVQAFDEAFGAGASAALEQGQAPRPTPVPQNRMGQTADPFNDSRAAAPPWSGAQNAPAPAQAAPAGLNFGGAAQAAPAPAQAVQTAPAAPSDAAKDAEIEALKAQLRAQTAAAAPAGSIQAQTGNPEDPPSEPAAEQEAPAVGAGINPVHTPDPDEVDPGEPELTMADLQGMTKGQLLSLVASEQKWGRLPADVSVASKTKPQIIDWLTTSH